MERICERVGGQDLATDADRQAVVRAFEDTVAVALAGWFEPVSIAIRRYASGNGPAMLDGSLATSAEAAALADATAGHALDYDDVHTLSVTHPSVVLVPVLTALAPWHAAGRSLASAYGVGVSVNIALGRMLGFDHYERGWHATSTIGPIAAAAAACHLLGLGERETRSALALAAAQAGGLQRNFGSMTKPVQAGNAAAAGVRAVLLAADGVTGDEDIFGEKGYGSLFGLDVADQAPLRPDDVHSVSLKLYPCCYATHRMIAAALEIREQAGDGVDIRSIERVRVTAPFETMRPLRIQDPQTGNEAKFCAAYALAVALLYGHVGLSDFTETAIHRPEVRSLMARICVEHDGASGRAAVGLDHGRVDLEVEGAGLRASASCTAFPGSPAAPPTRSQLDAKFSDCMAVYAQLSGNAVGLGDLRTRVQALLGDEDRSQVAARSVA